MSVAAASVVAACLSAALSVSAQTSQQPVPRFRSGVELVAVDVSVVDGDGRPVRNLTAEEFAVSVDGSPRRLVSATFIPLGADALPSREAAPTAAMPASPSYSTNEGAVGGRLVLFVVDRASIRPGEGRRLFEAAGGFIDQLGPADRVALAVIPGGGPYVEFTANGSLVKSALEKVVGGATPLLMNYHIGLTESVAIHRQDITTRERVVSRECYAASQELQATWCRMEVLAEARLIYETWRQQTTTSLSAVRDLLGRLELISGPKTMVLLTEGVYVDTRESTELNTVADAAARADVTLYAFGLDSERNDASTAQVSATPLDDRKLLRGGLEMVAGVAGGRAFSVPTGGTAQFERLARELSGYYLLSFEPEAGDDDGQPHRIDVAVSRGGVDVRTRRHFLVANEPASRPTSDVLAEILRTPRPSTDLRMRVATFVTPADDGTVRVVMAGAIEGSDDRGAVPCGFSLTNAAGETVLVRTEGVSATAEGPGDRHDYLASFALPPGGYTLRFAAVDAEGRRGSVEHAFDARLAMAGPLRVGDLMLADGGAEPSIDGSMRGDRLIGYVEYMGDPPVLDDARVSFELAATGSGKALAQAEAHIEAPSSGRRAAEGRLPLGALAPGDYVARAVVSAGDRVLATATRSFRVEGSTGPATAPEATEASTGEAPRSPGPAEIAGVAAFDPQRVLAPDIVGFALDRLPPAVGDSPAPPVAAGLDAARRGAFDAIEPALAGAGDADVGAAFLRGLALFARRDVDAATGRFQQALDLAPGFFGAAFYLGACRAAAGRDDQAVAVWQEALGAETEGSFTLELLADALLRAGDGPGAADVLTEARLLWPDEPGFARRLAVADAMARRHADAIAALDEYLAARPDDAGAWLLGAWLVYDARVSGRPLGTPEEDLARIGRYRDRYADAGGADTALIDQWIEAIRRRL